MKKIAAVLSALMLAVVMVGCAAEQPQPKLSETETLGPVSWRYSPEWEVESSQYNRSDQASFTYTVEGNEIEVRASVSSNVNYGQRLAEITSLAAMAKSSEQVFHAKDGDTETVAYTLTDLDTGNGVESMYMGATVKNGVASAMVIADTDAAEDAEEVLASVSIK